MKLHTLILHHKGYNLTKGDNSARLFDKVMLLYGLNKYQSSVGIHIGGSCDVVTLNHQYNSHRVFLYD